MEKGISADMAKLCRKLLRDDRGATAIEYGLIIGLVVVAIIGGISSLGGAAHNIWGNMTNKVAAVTPNA
jgi:pilus assembly protein Flp/PilA